MIELYNDYCIGVDDNEWTLYKKRKNGEDTKAYKRGEKYSYTPLAYTGSLRQALKSFRRRITADELKDASMSLTDALKRIEAIDARMEKFIGMTIPDV